LSDSTSHVTTDQALVALPDREPIIIQRTVLSA
jgi:hypothetical protein